MKILITGAEGQLGRELVDLLKPGNELYAYDLDLDIADFAAVAGKIQEKKPDFVINAAAMTDVDGCESQIDTAYKVNAIGPQNLALACRDASAVLVHISTDFVFDGCKGAAYTEFDSPHPQSVYGASKLAGERFVAGLTDKYYVVRTAWLYSKTGKNFVKTILKLADEREELRVVDDQTGSPTNARDLAETVIELMETGWYGLYHAANTGAVSWYGFARKILEYAGKERKIVPITSDELERPAKRPACSQLSNFCLGLRGVSPMRPWEEALKDVI